MNIRVPCPGCSGTGMKTFGDRHTATNKDICNDCGGEGTIPARTGETPEASAQPPVDFKAAMLALSYQERVRMWLHACFGEQISADTVERNHRFLEEALEFVQACDCTASEAHQLVDYVFGRPVGEKGQEAGAVMVTFAGACRAHVLAAHMEEGQITPAGREMVSVALDRVFPKLLHTRERCEVAECLVHGGCDECPTEAQVEAADAKLTGWLRENPQPDAALAEARSLEAACEPWRFGLGGSPDNGSPLAGVFSSGVTYAIRELGTLTNSAGWSLKDGSEDFQSDVHASLFDVLKHAGLYDPDTGRLATLTSVNDQGRTQVEEGLTAQIRALEEQIRKDSYAAFNAKADFEVELDALRLLLRRNEVRVGRQRELLQENNKLLDRARAAEGSNAKLRAALRHLFPFVDRAVGEGIFFGPDGKAPAMDALDVYAAAGRALGFEGVDDEALMALSAPGDTPPAAATVPVLYLNYRGLIEVRFIVPIRFWEGESEWHPGERHFLRVVEPSTRKVRDFALSGILAWGQAAIDHLESSDRTFQMLRDDLAAERDAKVCGEIEVRRHGLDPADPDSLHLRIAISQQLISGGPQIIEPIIEKAKAELSIVMTAREAQTARGAR